MSDLYDDVPVLVQKYVDDQDNEDLTAALETIKTRRTANDASASAAASTTGAT